jgi:uncharacterized protein involved in exopolysaccharide biosynthesis
MTPGRKYSLEDLVRILWSGKWALLALGVIGGAGMAIHARSLPNVYQSQAVIQVVP